MTELDVHFQNTVEFTGADLRHAYSGPLGEGVEGAADLLVSAGAAANAVDVAAGVGWVRGDGLSDLGLYRCRSDATKNSAAFEAGGLAAPDSTNPRIDQIIARVFDNDVDSEGSHKWRLAVLKGTATGGATLDNRTGAAALPNSAMLLADVLVVAGAPAVIKAANVRDRRSFCYPIVPPLLTDVDMVPLVPLAGQRVRNGFHGGFAGVDLCQVACAMVLPRRIVGATRIRWKYLQGAIAATGNYAIAIFDASGREVVNTGSVATVGAAKSFQARSEVIAATSFEAGLYYTFFGYDGTNEAEITYQAVDLANAQTGGAGPGAPYPNMALFNAAGGVAVPKTLLGMTDINTLGETSSMCGCPLIALSVG
jgi:hypothetical protein